MRFSNDYFNYRNLQVFITILFNTLKYYGIKWWFFTIFFAQISSSTSFFYRFKFLREKFSNNMPSCDEINL